MSHTIDLTINNQSIKMAKSKFWSPAFEFTSSATHLSYRWKADGKPFSGDLICFDEREQVFAKFDSSWAWKKDGTLELGPGIDGALMDEIVVTGIAMVEFNKREAASFTALATGNPIAAVLY